MEYRLADMIELHDHGIRLIVDSEADTVGLGFMDDAGTYHLGRNIILEGETLANLAELFGMELQDVSKSYFNQKKQKEITYIKSAKEFDFPVSIIYQDPYELSKDKLMRLFVKENERHIKIKMIIHVKLTNNKNLEEYQEIIREISYNGAYTIWWTSIE